MIGPHDLCVDDFLEASTFVKARDSEFLNSSELRACVGLR